MKRARKEAKDAAAEEQARKKAKMQQTAEDDVRRLIAEQAVGLRSYEKQGLLERIAKPSYEIKGKHAYQLELWLDTALGRQVTLAELPELGRFLRGRDTPYQTTRLEYSVASYWSDTQQSEVIPKVALEFLELVNPSIEVSLSKHDSVEVSFRDLGCTAKTIDDEKDDYAPSEWESKGDCYDWNQAVFDDEHRNGRAAWQFYLECLAKDTWDRAAEKQCLALWTGKTD